MFSLIVLDRFDRDLGGLPLREAEYAGRDAAKRNAFTAVFRRERQTGVIAGRELVAVLLRQPAADEGTVGVQYVFAGQIERRCDLRLSRGLLKALTRHDIGAQAAQLHARVRMDAVVDAVVTGLVTARHAAVGRVDDRVAGKRRDVPLPEAA